MTQVTLKQVADQAGVSVQTVSNVINGTGRVSPQTRERVTKIMEALQYTPNYAARALRKARTQTLAFVLQDPIYTTIPNMYLGQIVPRVAHAIREAGFDAQVVFESKPGLDVALSAHHKGLCDGVILYSSLITDDDITEAASKNLPLVLIEHIAPPRTLPTVWANYAEGIEQAVHHVHQMGARRIAYLDGVPHHHNTSSEARYTGYQRAMSQLSSTSPMLIYGGNWTFEAGIQAFDFFQALPEKPDAIVCANDNMALGVIHRATTSGLKVPDDLMVTGFDDFEYARYSTPSLTSLRLPLEDMAKAAVELLISRIENEEAPVESRLFPITLNIRNSTRK